VSDEKPLHMQVAEALGTVNSQEVPPWHYVTPRYDTSWSATGPLIEKYEIGIDKREAGWCATSVEPDFSCVHRADPEFADTPLIAVCHLLLALKAAGKLEVA
jgi:hypothetical protein